MVIGAIKGIGIADVQLLLAGFGLAFGAFNRHARSHQMVAQGLQESFFLGGLEQAVIFVMTIQRHKVCVFFFLEGAVIALEQKEFKLGRHHRVKAQGIKPRNLLFQHRTRGMGHGFVGVVIKDIAQHQNGFIQPRHLAHRRHIGAQDIVAIAGLPTGRCKAFGRGHHQIGGQQIVAAMGFRVGMVDEIGHVKTLAHQAALHIDKGHQDGVDLAVIGHFPERIEC